MKRKRFEDTPDCFESALDGVMRERIWHRALGEVRNLPGYSLPRIEDAGPLLLNDENPVSCEQCSVLDWKWRGLVFFHQTFCFIGNFLWDEIAFGAYDLAVLGYVGELMAVIYLASMGFRFDPTAFVEATNPFGTGLHHLRMHDEGLTASNLFKFICSVIVEHQDFDPAFIRALSLACRAGSLTIIFAVLLFCIPAAKRKIWRWLFAQPTLCRFCQRRRVKPSRSRRSGHAHLRTLLFMWLLASTDATDILRATLHQSESAREPMSAKSVHSWPTGVHATIAHDDTTNATSSTIWIDFCASPTLREDLVTGSATASEVLAGFAAPYTNTTCLRHECADLVEPTILHGDEEEASYLMQTTRGLRQTH